MTSIMSIIAVIILSAITLTAGSSILENQNSKIVPDPRFLASIGNRNYFIGVESTLKWFQAIEYCNSIDMSLASFETLDENNLVRAYLRNNNILEEMWVSAHMVEGGWLWTGVGTIVTFFDWSTGEPNYPNGDVAVHVSGTNGWVDDSWATFKNFLCEQK